MLAEDLLSVIPESTKYLSGIQVEQFTSFKNKEGLN